MSNEVLEAVREHGEKTAAEIKALESKFDRELNEIAQKMETAGSESVRGHASDPLTKAINSDTIKSVRAGNSTNAKVALEGGLRLLAKSIVSDVDSTDNDLYNVQEQRLPGIANDPRRRLSLLSALSHLSVVKDTVTFNRLDGYTAAAGYQVNQGDAKPEGALPTELATANIATIAHFMKASNQVLADEPALRQQVASLLQYGAMAKLEREIIVGAGTTGKIGGLTISGNFTSLTTASDDTLADAVGTAQAALDVAGWRAGLVIVHPTTWKNARAERADSGAGVYIAGSWANPVPPSVWSIPVVTSPYIAVDDVIVLDPSQVFVLDRQQATVEAGYVGDDFTNNLTTLRGELRAGLMVMAASAVMYGSI